MQFAMETKRILLFYLFLLFWLILGQVLAQTVVLAVSIEIAAGDISVELVTFHWSMYVEHSVSKMSQMHRLSLFMYDKLIYMS